MISVTKLSPALPCPDLIYHPQFLAVFPCNFVSSSGLPFTCSSCHALSYLVVLPQQCASHKNYTCHTVAHSESAAPVTILRADMSRTALAGWLYIRKKDIFHLQSTEISCVQLYSTVQYSYQLFYLPMYCHSLLKIMPSQHTYPCQSNGGQGQEKHSRQPRCSSQHVSLPSLKAPVVRNFLPLHFICRFCHEQFLLKNFCNTFTRLGTTITTCTN